MRFAFALLLGLHGLIHSAGFAKAWGWLRVPLEASVSRPLGLLWLGATILFLLAGLMFGLGARGYWVAGILAVALSQVLIMTDLSEARFGTLLNAIVLGPLLVSLASHVRERTGTSFSVIYGSESKLRLASAPPASELLTAADLAHLPPPVARYLEVSGVIGKPRVTSFRATLRGRIRRTPTSGWLDFDAEQHNFEVDRARLFLMHARQWGVPFEAWHRYADGQATMKVRLASLFDLVDARGPEMNQSETVTLFNDMCLLAPATLLEPAVRFQGIDGRSVSAEFAHAGNTVHALLSFAEDGTLANFQSDDRYLSSDGKTFAKHRWSTPVLSYRDVGGRRLPWHAQASWAMPDGELVYAELEIMNVEYDVAR